MSEDNKEISLLPHHTQQELCSTRLPYRQGRKLTAVKTYSINNESRHLLIFNVPSLNLRQETKALLSKFGKVQLNITKYPSEQFTETYHAIYQDIQSARTAKKFLDTKNFYGGNLHVCYAPEKESIDDTRSKLLLRQKSVIGRLKNLQRAAENDATVKKTDVNMDTREDIVDSTDKKSHTINSNENKLYMGEKNSIGYVINSTKRKVTDYKAVKHCKLKKSKIFHKTCVAVTEEDNNVAIESKNDDKIVENKDGSSSLSNIVCDVIDFTSTDKEVLSNINEGLNYNNFGTEVIKEVPYKPVNKIKFNLNKTK